MLFRSANETSTLTITLSSAKTNKTYPARVFAGMRIRDIPKQKRTPIQSVTVPGTTNFYNMVHGHGPMFESELVAYRVYFNQKQTIDPYGKFNKGLEIQASHNLRKSASRQLLAHKPFVVVDREKNIGIIKAKE